MSVHRHYTYGDRIMGKNSSSTPIQADLDNRSRQLNPQDQTYRDSRGEDAPIDPGAAREDVAPMTKDD